MTTMTKSQVKRQDYVTEKFFKILPYNVIPVVMNGANMSRVAPPHSFINVMDFNTTEQLARYLHRLDQDDHLFASYFWWRDYYEVKGLGEYHGKDLKLLASWCELCQLLHQTNLTDRSFDVTKTLSLKNNCKRPPIIKY